MSLFDIVRGKPFREDVGHFLRRESYREREFGVVPGHSGDVLERE